MKVGAQTVVKLEYTLMIDGKIIDRTLKGETQTILIGHARGLPIGLENLLFERNAGETFNSSLEPEDAYGFYDPSKRITAKAADFPTKTKLEIGNRFYTQNTAGQPLEARVIAVNGDQITVDFNHQYAGKTLKYSITIHSVREAEASELEHGHVHGEGGVTHKHNEAHNH